RKQYKERIEEAKQLRKVENYEVKETKVVEPTSITLNDVIDFLQNYKDENSLMVLQQQIESLQTERESLLERLSVYEEEYRTLLDYIDQKRSVMVAERNSARSNGKLEKLKK
ncbi:RsfA family transcriptional regulator, partial [Bacillus wiedmannii]